MTSAKSLKPFLTMWTCLRSYGWRCCCEAFHQVSTINFKQLSNHWERKSGSESSSFANKATRAAWSCVWNRKVNLAWELSAPPKFFPQFCSGSRIQKKTWPRSIERSSCYSWGRNAAMALVLANDEKDYQIQPTASTPAVDTSSWPLLLKNYDKREFLSFSVRATS